MNPQEKKDLENELRETIKQLELCSKAYNSRSLKVIILLSGQDMEGETFAGTIFADKNNHYLREFFNQYGAACAAARITAEHLLISSENIAPRD